MVPMFTHLSFKPKLKKQRQTLCGSPVDDICDTLENQKLNINILAKVDINHKDSCSSKSKSKKSKKSSQIKNVNVGSSRLEKAIKAYKSNDKQNKLSKILKEQKQVNKKYKKLKIKSKNCHKYRDTSKDSRQSARSKSSPKTISKKNIAFK